MLVVLLNVVVVLGIVVIGVVIGIVGELVFGGVVVVGPENSCIWCSC